LKKHPKVAHLEYFKNKKYAYYFAWAKKYLQINTTKECHAPDEFGRGWALARRPSAGSEELVGNKVPSQNFSLITS
jgi:hypothetical protein